jgi:glycosyltransferase involved in cell wall biosynthesis
LTAATGGDLQKVWIVLATYNGGAFLSEQLGSIRQQSFTGWRLLIRDDGSTDASPALVQQFARLDRRIEILADGESRLGPVGNFSALLTAALGRGAEYVFTCDQDDVWHADKMQEELALMTTAEADEPGGAVLVHTDLAVVDERLNPRHASFMRFQRIRHEPDEPLRTLLVQNFVTGSTCLANRRLLEAALPVPQQAVMHDWWLALCAAALGTIRFFPKTTVLYRQHGGNAVGAGGFWASVNPLQKTWRLSSPAATREFRRLLDQARALRDRLRAVVAAGRQSLTLVDEFCRLFDERLPRLERARRLRALKVRRQEPIRNALLLSRLLLTPGHHYLTPPTEGSLLAPRRNAE